MSEQRLIDSLEQVRTAYLEFYRDLIRRLREQEVRFGVEVQVLVGDGKNPHGSRYNLPLRLDVLRETPRGPQVLAVELDEPPPLTPLGLHLDGKELVLTPFHWNRCEFLFEGSTDDWRPVLRWFERWFDRQEERPRDEDGLLGVIHSVSEPVTTPQGRLISADFGSAPPEAARELLLALLEVGLDQIRIGTFTARPGKGQAQG